MNINKVIFNRISPDLEFRKYQEKSRNYDFSFSDAKFIFSYPKNYYLNFRGSADFKKQLEEKLENGLEDEIFMFLDSELRKRAQELKINFQIIDDVVQNALLDIFILISNSDLSKDELLNSIDKIYIGLKPQKDDYIKRYNETSLDRKILDGKKDIQDTIPDDEEHKIQYLRPKDEKEKAEIENELDSAISKSNLKEREQEILKERYSQSKASTYALAKKYGISQSLIYRIIASAIIKIQIANGTLPKKTTDKIEAICKTFNLDNETVKKIIIRYPAVLYNSPEALEKNVKGFVKKFECNGLTLDKYIQACIKISTLFCQSPETLEKNVKNLVKKFKDYGLTLDKCVPACVKQPSLLAISPDTIEKNVKDLVERFKDNGLTLDKYIPACVKQPQLFTQSPDTIEKNVKNLVEKFETYGLTLDKYIQACIKMPPLFYQSTDTVEKRVKDLVERFKDNGLTPDRYIKACVKAPQLFCQSPDTIEKNVKNLVERFKDNGLTLDKYIQACVKQPSLFHLSPDTIEKNVKNLVEKFKDNGLTLDNYISPCVKQPSLFTVKPETIEKNVKNLVEKFKDNGLTLDNYISTCIKQPQLFCQSPDTIGEHIDILRLSYFNTGKEIDNDDFFKKILSKPLELGCSSKLLLIKYLIIPKMFESSNSKIPNSLKRNHLKEKLNEYLKENPNRTYCINIRNIDAETDYSKLLKETLAAISNVGFILI